jgi:MFS family permease
MQVWRSNADDMIAPMLGAAFGSFAAGVYYDKLGPTTILGLCNFGSIIAVLVQFLSTTPMALFIGQVGFCIHCLIPYI